jgi:phosphoribosylformylglycinamidine cyclo-ligase
MADKPTEPGKGLTYRDAGVDIDTQDAALARIKKMVKGTRTPGVLSELGSFGGLFKLASSDMTGDSEPILVSSADGVGTKLRIAFMTGVHNTVGRDLVNHCVNDILVQGAKPLFFLDYVATGRLDADVLVQVVEGIASGCKAAGCALLGGETAEMPGFYADDEYDVAGFIVGLVQRDKLLDGSRIRPGHVLIGLPSAGLHTNGYSLARKILLDVGGLSVNDRLEECDRTVGEVLLAEHRCYLKPLEALLDKGSISALAHITGGGLTDNLPRVLPDGTAVTIKRGSWPVPPIFSVMQRMGNVADDEMYRTFNMGVGMVAIVDPDEAVLLECHLDGLSTEHFRIGEVVANADGDGDVRYV